MAHGHIEAQPLATQHAQDANGGGQQRRLRHVRARQEFRSPFATDARQIVAEHRGGLRVRLSHEGVHHAQVGTHPDRLGSLAGEHQHELVQG